MSDQELVERLISVRGIGAWTVEMFLIFRLGRPDVLPIHDYGVQKGFALTYRKKRIPKPKELAEVRRALAPLSHRRQLVHVARRRTRRQSRPQNHQEPNPQKSALSKRSASCGKRTGKKPRVTRRKG